MVKNHDYVSAFFYCFAEIMAFMWMYEWRNQNTLTPNGFLPFFFLLIQKRGLVDFSTNFYYRFDGIVEEEDISVKVISVFLDFNVT